MGEKEGDGGEEKLDVFRQLVLAFAHSPANPSNSLDPDAHPDPTQPYHR